MKVFLSHSSVDKDIAESLSIALRQANHKVFFDKSELPAGESFHTSIRKAIFKCDLFIFLVSPRAILEGTYARTELKFMQSKWDSPNGKVLAVMLSPIDSSELPPYLRSVTHLRPEGDVVAETLHRIDQITRDVHRSKLRRIFLPAAMAVPLVLLAFGLSHTLFDTGERRVFVIDASVSLRGKAFEKVLMASAQIIDKGNHQDEFAIIAIRDTFRGNVLVSDFTNDQKQLALGLANIRSDGRNTALFDGMYDALNICRNPTSQRMWYNFGSAPNCSMIVFSDGRDEGSMITKEDFKLRVRELKVPIFTVGISNSSNSYLPILLYFSRISAGEFYNSSEIKSLINRIYEKREGHLNLNTIAKFFYME